MPSVFPLPNLVDAVAALFVEEGVAAPVRFGRREPVKQGGADTARTGRVIFAPGVGPKVGDYAPARNPGRNPRPIATLREVATVYVWARDPNAQPTDERAHYEAVRLLHDAVVRAIHLGAQPGKANVEYAISAPTWVAPERERSFGLELQFTLTVSAMIPDTPWPEVEASEDNPITPSLTGEMEFPGGAVPGCVGA